MRSFIKPRKKKLVDPISLMWLLFIALMAAGLLFFSMLLHYKSSFYIRMLENMGKENSAKREQVRHIGREIALLKAQVKIYDEVNSSNSALKESMRNLFDLIPDQITLTKVVMKKESLYLKGYTLSKAAYTTLLEPPLKSVFARSSVRFVTDAKGCLMFESFNSMEEEGAEADKIMTETQDGNRSE